MVITSLAISNTSQASFLWLHPWVYRAYNDIQHLAISDRTFFLKMFFLVNSYIMIHHVSSCYIPLNHHSSSFFVSTSPGTDYEALCSLAMRLQCNGWTNYSKPLQADGGLRLAEVSEKMGTTSHHPF